MNIQDRMTVIAAFKSFRKRCITNFAINILIALVIISALVYLLWGGMIASPFHMLLSFLPLIVISCSYIVCFAIALIATCLILKNLLKQGSQVSQALRYANYKISHPNLIPKDIPVINYYHIRIDLPSKH